MINRESKGKGWDNYEKNRFHVCIIDDYLFCFCRYSGTIKVNTGK